MKKAFLSLGFTFVLAFVAACNSGGGTTTTTNNNNQAITNPQTETPSEPTTGTFTLQNDCTTVSIERFYISPTTS